MASAHTFFQVIFVLPLALALALVCATHAFGELELMLHSNTMGAHEFQLMCQRVQADVPPRTVKVHSRSAGELARPVPRIHAPEPVVDNTPTSPTPSPVLVQVVPPARQSVPAIPPRGILRTTISVLDDKVRTSWYASNELHTVVM